MNPHNAIRHRRLRSETATLTLRLAEGQHKLDVSLAYDENYILRELTFVGRGKAGHGLDSMLHELGIQLSRVIQGRHPDTGEEYVSPRYHRKTIMLSVEEGARSR